MKWLSLAAATALVPYAVAEDLLFKDTLVGLEQAEAQSLGFTTKVVDDATWRSMTTADFASYKAIIIGDDFGSQDLTLIQFLQDTNTVWGPAVTGNIIIHGADQSNHDKTVLIDNSIKFAASGTGTGLYFSLSQYYDQIAVADVGALSYFGTFEVRGQLDCYDQVHIVASSPSITTLTDAYLSDWSCSVHEAFSAFPQTGLNGFQAIAIADGVVAPGTQQFAGGHSGLPYIITRGATPAGCGDGHWDAPLNEECDDGPSNGKPGDPCSASCKCVSGKANGDGTCAAGNGTTPVGPTGGAGKPSGYTPIPSGKPSGYGNSSTPPYPTTTPPYPITTPPPPYVTPSIPSVSCIGVEIIVSVTVVESCSTVAPGSTVTYTTTSACSTYQKPIYNTPIPTMPCYVCAMSSQGIPTKSIGFITATTTYCPVCTSKPPPATIYACPTCSGIQLTATCPWATTPPFNANPYTSYAPMTEVHTVGSGNGATVTSQAYLTTSVKNGAPTTYVTAPTGTNGPTQFTGAAANQKAGAGIMGVVLAVFALVM